MRPGTHILRRIGSPDTFSVDYASVSARESSFVRVAVGDEEVEYVYVGPYSPHTWWSGNALFGRRGPAVDEVVTIEVGPAAVFRLEGDFREDLA